MLQDPSLKTSAVWGHIGDQIVRRNFRGVTLVKRRRRIKQSGLAEAEGRQGLLIDANLTTYYKKEGICVNLAAI